MTPKNFEKITNGVLNIIVGAGIIVAVTMWAIS